MKTRWCKIGTALVVLITAIGLLGLSQPVAPKGIIVVPPDPTGLTARIWVDKGAYRIGEQIQIHFSVTEDAYIYIRDIDPAGKQLWLLPSTWSPNNYVTAGEHVLPDLPTYNLKVGGPEGTEYLEIIASKQALDISKWADQSQKFWSLGVDPETFKLQFQAQVLGILPEPTYAENWTSFQVVSGTVPTYGTLIINSTPSGAWITLDGAYVGYTPRTQSVLPGYHQVVLTKSGYRDWSARVPVLGGATSRINATLEPIGPTNQPPIAAFTVSPASPGVLAWVRFDASGSTDPDGTITAYQWNFSDGTPPVTGSVVYHQFTAAGSYPVTLTVTDNLGATDTETRTVRVGPTNQPPIAAFTVSPASPGVLAWVRFDASGSTDPDGTITAYQWNFSDGTPPVTGSVVYHQFTAAGSYPVTLTVTDNLGATDTETQTVWVGPTNQPPVAAFTYWPPSPLVGELISLSATGSYDPDGTIVSYLWDLDGNGVDDASGPTTSVRYYNLGMHPVRLTVVDNGGLSTSTIQGIFVGMGGGLPGSPPMDGTPGIFVWGSDTWHVTVNAGSSWTSPHSYRLELRTDGSFQGVNQSTSGGVAPLGIIPTPTDSGKTLFFEGSLSSGSIDYTFTVSGSSKSIWMSLRLDSDGNGTLEESPGFVYLRTFMVHPPTAPFVVGLPRGSSGPLVPSMDFQIGYALAYTSTVRLVFYTTTISQLEGY